MDAVPVDPAAVADLVGTGAILLLRGFIIEKTVDVSGPGGDF